MGTRGGLELTILTYTVLEDNVIRHRGDRIYIIYLLRPFIGIILRRFSDKAHGTRE